MRLLVLLLALRHGVSPLHSGEGADTGAGGGTEEEAELEQLERMEEQECPETEVEVAADCLQISAAESEQELLTLLDDARPRPQPEDSGDGDIVTGVPASESAMAYVAGFVARKAATSGAFASPMYGPQRSLWVRLRSQHSLTLPSEEMWQLFIDIEASFCTHHAQEPDQLSRSRGVIATSKPRWPTSPPMSLRRSVLRSPRRGLSSGWGG